MAHATDLVDTDTVRIQGSIANDLVISDGQVQCPVCEKDIRVGMGGLPNFWKQHNPGKSKACQLALKKKNKLKATQRSQPSLQSFFTQNPKVPVPPTVPIARRVIAHVIEPTSSVANVSALPPIPNTTLVKNLLADLEKAISNLPNTHTDTTKMEELTMFPPFLPTDMDCDDAWALILDPHLNCFLGFGKSVESVAASLKGQEKELVSLAKFLRYYCQIGQKAITGQ
ncbi:hypothetical protein F5888DRAFT_1801651 [Russula emetica]|nr:hypothetical protein F5888DRAFT_1801651 [Russula emetica]